MTETPTMPAPPPELAMRRQPRQQRSWQVVRLIEEATLALLTEQGYTALNTNAIAERAGVGIKSLYHLFPNKEAIVYRLAVNWLNAIHESQQQIQQQCADLRATLDAVDHMLAELDQRFSGYGPLWQAMAEIPGLQALEVAHERIQVSFWSARFRALGCQWPERELRTLVTYFYRTSDVARQCATQLGDDGRLAWQLQRSWLDALLGTAITEPDASHSLSRLQLLMAVKPQA